jgi:hypothetical protein
MEYGNGPRNHESPPQGPQPKEKLSPEAQAAKAERKAGSAVNRVDVITGRGELNRNLTPEEQAAKKKRIEEYAAADRYRKAQESNKKSFDGHISNTFRKAESIRVGYQKKIVVEYAVSAFKEWNKENYIGANKIVATAATIADAFLGTLPLGLNPFDEHLRTVSMNGLRSAPGNPKELGDYAMAAAIVDHVAGKETEANDELSFANFMFEIGLSANPYTSIPKDACEFATGKSISGKEIGDLGRFFALVGIGLSIGLPGAKSAVGAAKAGYKVAVKAGIARRIAQVFEVEIENIVMHSADELNAINRILKPNVKDYYRAVSSAFDFTAPVTIEGKYVRVLTQRGSLKPAGNWIVEAASIEGKTPRQIEILLSLPSESGPITHVVDVTINAGDRLRTSLPAKVMQGVDSSLTLRQWEFLSKIKNSQFTNLRELN